MSEVLTVEKVDLFEEMYLEAGELVAAGSWHVKVKSS
jgi:hypothetical protein